MRGVQNTEELRRIAALPRRDLASVEAFAADVLTDMLRTPDGAMILKPIQGAALWEMALFGGAVLPIGVGFGKTLISFLAPSVMDCSRPLLLNPKSLIPKTLDAMEVLRRHWVFPEPTIHSYTAVSRDPDLLVRLAPDLIFCDEAQALKNEGSGVTQRLLRAVAAGARLVAASGSFTTRSLTEYAHTVRAALGAERAPVPRGTELAEWSSALDVYDPRDPAPRYSPGALLTYFADPEERATLGDLEAARRGYRRRLVQTPGIVATSEASIGTSLVIAKADYTPGPGALAALDRLRTKWELPDGTALVDGLEVARHAKDLALGFWDRWDPPPPDAWLEARRAWNAAARHILATNRRQLDTESEVVKAIEEGLYPQYEGALEEWRAIAKTYTYEVITEWVDDCGLAACERWAQRNPAGVIWSKRLTFARALAKRLDVPCYGEAGLDIETGELFPQWGGSQHDRCGVGVVVSTLANATGMNLQGWNRALVVSPMSGGDVWEQCLGREHRPFQPADTVQYDVFLATPEQRAAMDKARESARYIESTTGQPQRLLYADDLTRK